MLIKLVYFSFTSLSTVGFGDFNPKSDAERLLCAFILMLGVAIFTMIMGNFSSILTEITLMNADLGDMEGLARFLNILKQKNNGVPLPKKFTNKIE